MSSNVLALEPVRILHNDGKPERAEVEAAVQTIIRWSGENPDREGLIETPARVTRAFEEAFVGYIQDPAAILQKSFDEIEGYDEVIVLRGIPFESHCEHHMAPILGKAWVAYIPNGRVVGSVAMAMPQVHIVAYCGDLGYGPVRGNGLAQKRLLSLSDVVG
jgi:GTP cyclohydrolase I